MEQLSTMKKLWLAAAISAVVVVPMAVGLLSAPTAVAQTPIASSTPLTFDSVSIVKTKSSTPDGWFGMKDGTLTTTHMSLREVISFAYGVDKSLVLGGADWLNTPLYDITAHTASPGVTGALNNPMGKAMLAARFGLIVHPETRQLPVYVLRVAEGGSKLYAVTDEPPDQDRQSLVIVRKNFLIGSASEISGIKALLTPTLGRPVVDKTGLTGRYDFAMTGTLNAETLPTALREQLGLTIESATAPVEVLVIDSVHQPSLDTVAAPST